jgi:hypothetical protein
MRYHDAYCTAQDAARPATGEEPLDTRPRTIYWHRELPPLAAEPVAEHFVEAVSCRVSGTIAHRDELWSRCYTDLMARAADRLQQEVERLGGRYAHVLEESIDSRHDDATGESWLAGRFRYMLLT